MKTKKRSERRHRSRTNESTRELLLSAAIKLFALKGYDGVSIKQLVEEAGVNVSLVSYHFGGKEGLYRACLDEFGQANLATAERLLHPASSCEEFKVRLRVFVDEFFRSYIEEPDLTKIIQRDIDLDNPISEDVFRKRFLKIFEKLVEFFSSAQKKNIMVVPGSRIANIAVSIKTNPILLKCTNTFVIALPLLLLAPLCMHQRQASPQSIAFSLRCLAH